MPLITGETFVRRRPVSTTADRYGDPLVGSFNELPIKRCAFAPAGSSTRYGARVSVLESDTVYAPPGADVQAGDRLVVRGVERQVAGAPEVWVSPYDGRTRGVAISLKTVTEG